MDWTQGLFNVLSAGIGGGMVILGQKIRSWDEAKARTFDGIAQLYTDFLVAFHTALMLNESFYERVRLRSERGWKIKDTAEEYKTRNEAKQRFRETVWRLRVRERDAEQIKMLEDMARVFDSDIDEFDARESTAQEYPDTAKALRAKATAIIARMQQLHDAR